MLEAFFAPKAVAVIGASRDETKLGHSVLKNIVQYGYKGKVYPINPKAEDILGLKCYKSVRDVPNAVDLAVVVVPRPVVAPVISDCVAHKVKAAIVIAAGFREAGPRGAKAESEIVRIAKQGGMRLLGPNTLGLIDTQSFLNASFAASMPSPGRIALMSQSGALCTSILDWANREKVGFSKFVSLGNKADITELDLLEALGEDAASSVIVGYLEGIADGQRFMQLAVEVTKRKPLILVKSGSTAAGSRAVSSHTGTLAGSDTAYETAFKQSGVIRATSMEGLFDLSLAFAYQPLPKGKRVAIVTNAGGPGIMATDALERSGLELATFQPETVRTLRKHLPSAAAVYNPVDVIGDARADRYRVALRTVLQDPGVESVVVILTPQVMTEIEETARAIVEEATETDKAIIASFMGGDLIEPGVRILTEGHVPNYLFPERAVAALVAMNRQWEWQSKPLGQPEHFEARKERVKEVLQRVRGGQRDALGDVEAREVLEAYGLHTPRSRLAKSSEEAVHLAEEIGLPVVMKIVSPNILHKSDIGGVRVGLRTLDEVATAYVTIVGNARRYMPQAEIWGVAVQELVKPGREVIVGVTFDPQFGHLLMFGMGGIYVEVLKDVTFRVAPLTRDVALDMIREIRAYLLLRGVRGEPPADVEAIVDALLRISQLVGDFPDILELDVNPLIVHEAGRGATAVDCRIILRPVR
ncbi:MAG: acetate--CoA ligase family protein [Chloroflexi bacterium]|nr:acetate--CoA ligase family protein [Chloroflexota bacterium]MCL5074799.1 acetate--CoA ligase family protein [Chloroflexota bacterium]